MSNWDNFTFTLTKKCFCDQRFIFKERRNGNKNLIKITVWQTELYTTYLNTMSCLKDIEVYDRVNCMKDT